MSGIPVTVSVERTVGSHGLPDRVLVCVNGEVFIDKPLLFAARSYSESQVGIVPLVHADLAKIAASLEEQEAQIPDEADQQQLIRPRLIRAAAHIRLAYAELAAMPLVMTDETVPIEQRPAGPRARRGLHHVDTSGTNGARDGAPIGVDRDIGEGRHICGGCGFPLDAPGADCPRHGGVDPSITEAVAIEDVQAPADPLEREFQSALPVAQMRELFGTALNTGPMVRRESVAVVTRLEDLLPVLLPGLRAIEVPEGDAAAAIELRALFAEGLGADPANEGSFAPLAERLDSLLTDAFVAWHAVSGAPSIR